MRRLLVICAASAAIVAAIYGAFSGFNFGKFSSAWPIRSVMAGSTGALTLRAATPVSGCPLTPLFSFCSQLSGGSTAPAQFTLTASGAVSGLAIKLAAATGPRSSLFTMGDFTVESTTCGASLASGGSCNINVSFTPLGLTKGTRVAALAVTDSGKDTAIVNLTGTALNNVSGGSTALGFQTPPAPACPQDNAFTFCAQAVHTASSTESFLLTSGATVTGLTFSFAAVPGLTSEFALSDFTIASNPCGSTLAAGASCTIGVQFTPTATGMRAATLTATDADGDSTVLYLAGSTTSGLAMAPTGQVPVCSPGNTFEFCNTPTGGAAAGEAFTLTNTSGVQLTGVTVPAATTAGDFKVTGTSCLSVLPAAGSCTINTLFSPATTGLLQEALVVTDADGDVATANLAGTGDNYSLALAATQPMEVSVAQAGTITIMAVLTPDTVFGQDGEQVTFACPPTAGLPINTSCAVTPCPATITPGTTSNISITFVTSSKTVQAPLPAPGCSSYGPPPTAAILGPPAQREIRGPGGKLAPDIGWLLPAGVPLVLLAAMALGGLAAGMRRRKNLAFFAAAAIVAALLTGCKHGSGVTTATPIGATSMNIQAIATDASGNSLNTSRVIQGAQGAGFILDVIQGK